MARRRARSAYYLGPCTARTELGSTSPILSRDAFVQVGWWGLVGAGRYDICGCSRLRRLLPRLVEVRTFRHSGSQGLLDSPSSPLCFCPRLATPLGSVRPTSNRSRLLRSIGADNLTTTGSTCICFQSGLVSMLNFAEDGHAGCGLKRIMMRAPQVLAEGDHCVYLG